MVDDKFACSWYMYMDNWWIVFNWGIMRDEPCLVGFDSIVSIIFKVGKWETNLVKNGL